MKREQSTGPFLSAVFVDYDNIYLSLKRKSDEAAKRFAKDALTWVKAIENSSLITPTNGLFAEGTRRIVMNRCYGNPVPRRNQNDNSTDMNSFPFTRHHFLRAGFEIIDCPPLTQQLKNSSDIRMVMDMRDYLTHPTYFDEFVILSGDADFTPVLHRLRAHARRTVIYANDHTAAPYTAICDGEIREADLISLLLDGKVKIEPEVNAKIESIDPQIARQEIMADVIAAVRASPSPMPLEALADRAVRQVGHEKTIGTSWGGAGGFRELLAQGLPADLRLSGEPPYVVIDTTRHVAAQPQPVRLQVQAPPPVTPKVQVKPQARPAVQAQPAVQGQFSQLQPASAAAPVAAAAPQRQIPAPQPAVTHVAQSIQHAPVPPMAPQVQEPIQYVSGGFYDVEKPYDVGAAPEVVQAQIQPAPRQFAPQVQSPPQPPAQRLVQGQHQAVAVTAERDAAARAPSVTSNLNSSVPRTKAGAPPPATQMSSAAGVATAPVRARLNEPVSNARAPNPVAGEPQSQAYTTPAPMPSAPANQQQPLPRGGEAASAIHQSIARIHEACQAPPLAPPEYRTLFEVMAQEINENGLIGAQTISNIAQRALERGIEVRRDDVRFVLEVVSEADPWFEQGASANLFAGRFRNFVVARCRSQGLNLSADELDLIEAWFAGGGQVAQRPQADVHPPQALVPQPQSRFSMQQQAATADHRNWSLEEGRRHVAEQRQVAQDPEAAADDFPRIVRTRLRG